MSKSILVTGGAGFIASHVVNSLVANYPDYKVRESHSRARFMLFRFLNAQSYY